MYGSLIGGASLVVAWLCVASDAVVTFEPIRITLDVDALVDGQDTSDSCSIGQVVEMTCSSIGDVICISTTTPSYTCTENDMINGTTQTAALAALRKAIATLSFLQVNRAASAVLALNASTCIKDTAPTPNVDHIIVITMRPADAIAQGSAILCLESPVDARPLVSNINIPPATTADTALLESNTLRFMIQALGFDYSSVEGYIAEYEPVGGGGPRTYYASDPLAFPNGPLRLVSPGGTPDSSTPSVPRGTILKDDSWTSNSDGGVRLQLTTPRVVAAARLQFACPTLAGVLLEEQNSAWMRWERRQVNFEIMGSGLTVPTTTPVLSNMTIAAFEDMGFYRVDHDAAAFVVSLLPWGLGMGCAFTQGCSSDAWGHTFCTQSGAAPSFDFTYWGTCFVVSYPSALGAPYEHFPNSVVGGADSIADYCPYLAEYSATDPDSTLTICTTAATSTAATAVNSLDSSAVGPYCRAVRSNLVNQTYVAPGNTTTGPPRCMELMCLNTTHVAVRVGQRYFTCQVGDRTVLTFPLSHPSYTPAAAAAVSGSTYWTDYAFNGVWDCPNASYVCQRAMGSAAPFRATSGTSSTASITLSAAMWPELVDVDPPYGVVTGGEPITVRGRHLFQRDASMVPISCRGLWIGGASTDFESFESLGTNVTSGLDAFIVNTTALPQGLGGDSSSGGSGSGSGGTSYLGGAGDDGSGVVDVALLCKIPGVMECASEDDAGGGFSDGYCAVGVVRGAFTFTPVPPTPPATYFLSDGTNQAIIISIFAAVMLIIMVAIYKYCKATYAAPDGITLAKLHQEEDGDDAELNDMSNTALNMQLLADMAAAGEAHRTAL